MATVKLAPWQVAALAQNFEHFYMAGGVATGKTFTGSQFSIDNIEKGKGLTGLIGANTYDQLSQATLREFFYWLDDNKYDYVVDQRPPPSWGARREFKTYKNVITVRPKTWKGNVPILTRVMAKGDALRGVEFSWYWLDETRDTPQNTHDVVISRMRESITYRRGIITSTPNGEDWAYKRFVSGARKGQRLYGSMHVKTEESVKAGIISQGYYDAMRATYSELMALQELDALHLNVRGGRAYYAFGPHNRSSLAPWGDQYPNPDRPLVVGCDFNYSPAPCVWMIGQQGPELYGPDGTLWSEHIHWFGEISMAESSTPQMTTGLITRYPGFFYRIFGDSYGNRGTTSNAGYHDYAQMNQVLADNGCVFTIDVDQSNPHVKDRVENMNRLARNSLGQVRMTYNPSTCPLFDRDVKMVGWRLTNTLTGRGKLDDGGDKQLTHGTDGAGYAVWKLFPPTIRTQMVQPLPSTVGGELRRSF